MIGRTWSLVVGVCALSGCYEETVSLIDPDPAEEELEPATETSRPAVEHLEPVVPAVDDTGTCWAIETVDEHAEDPALAIDGEGGLHVVYEHLGDGTHETRYATKTDGAWDVESAGFQSGRRTLALAPDGAAHVAYTSMPGVHHATNESGVWQNDVVDAAGDAGASAVIGRDAGGVLHLTYYGTQEDDAAVPGLMQATRGMTDPMWRLAVVSTPARDFMSSLAIGDDGSVHVSFMARMDGGGVNHLTNESGAWVREQLEEGHGDVSSIAHGPDGRIDVVYQTAPQGGGVAADELWLATRVGGSWSTRTLRSEASGPRPALAVDGAGARHVAYFLDTWPAGEQQPTGGAVRYASDATTEWSDELVDPELLTFTTPAIALDADGVPHIAYATGIDADHPGELRHAWRTCSMP